MVPMPTPARSATSERQAWRPFSAKTSLAAARSRSRLRTASRRRDRAAGPGPPSGRPAGPGPPSGRPTAQTRGGLAVRVGTPTTLADAESCVPFLSWPQVHVPRRVSPLWVADRLESSNVPALCDRLRALVESGGAGDVLCDVGSLVNCDLRALEALARLGLTAKQLGCELS